jgi:hypothetical protein
VELEIMLIKFYAKVNPSNMSIVNEIAARFAGTNESYLKLNQQLLDEYGTDLEQMLVLTGWYLEMCPVQELDLIPIRQARELRARGS